MIGLSAAVQAAAGARHDFDGMIVRFAALDLLQKLARVAESGTDRRLEFETADLDGGFLDPFESADRLEVDFLQILSGDPVRRGAERRFEHAAGCSEDDRRAGGFAERGIICLLVKLVELNARFADHVGKFAC